MNQFERANKKAPLNIGKSVEKDEVFSSGSKVPAKNKIRTQIKITIENPKNRPNKKVVVRGIYFSVVICLNFVCPYFY